MQNKIIILLIAAAVGAGVGALLGYGPMLKYKSEGLLNMEMGTSEYKRFTELANDTVSINQYIAAFPPFKATSKSGDSLVKTVTIGEWHKAQPKVSKVDAKDVPDALLQMEKEKEKEKASSKNRNDNFVYLGLRIIHISADPIEAAQITTWLGGYFKEVAAREAVRELVARWIAENRQFSDRALEMKFKYAFDIEQAKNRALALKKLVAQYPESVVGDARQVVDVRKDNEKFMSPLAQLVGAESEIIEFNEKLQKLNREIEQQVFAKTLVKDVESSLKVSRSGSESVSKLAEVITNYEKIVKTDAEREKLLSLAADLSQISARFLSQAEFVAQPSVPTRPERPTPLMYIFLMGMLFTLLAAIYVWRDMIINFIKQNTDTV